MNLLQNLPLLYEKIDTFILAFTRISALFSTFVFFRREFLNARIIVALSAILALFVIIYNGSSTVNYDMVSIKMLIDSVTQFFIGFLSGLILNIVFEIFTALGQIVSTQIGLSLASVIDPRLGSISNLTQFYIYSITIVFLSMNGHLFVIKTIMESFATLPLGHVFDYHFLLKDIFNYSGIIFSGSLLLSVTVILAILITNFSLALMTRFAPQFNLFSIGINITMILGLFCVYLTFNLFIDRGSSILQQGFAFLSNLIGGLH